MLAEYAIQTDGLTRNFGLVRAVDRLSLEVPMGCVFGFVGQNGAGKTTTIRLLLGLLAPTGGQGVVLGHDIRKCADAIRLCAGALLEDTGLYERLSAQDNLDFYGRVWGLSQAERTTRIKDLLTSFDLWGRRSERVGGWSRGMKQKLAVARTLLHRPALVFLDEPTSGLDPVASAHLWDDLASMVMCEGVTIFLTTHNLAEANKWCNRIGVIRSGTLLAVDSPEALRARFGPSHLEIVGRGLDVRVLEMVQSHPAVAAATLYDGRMTIELDGCSDRGQLVRFLVDTGVEIDEVRKGGASLEDAVVRMLGDAVP